MTCESFNMIKEIDVFKRYYAFDRLDKSNAYYESKKTNYLLAKEAYFSDAAKIDAMPLRATMQTTDYCNLNCIMCQIHSQREKHSLKQMDVSNFDKIVEKIFPTLIEAHPTNIGEPLISPWFGHLCEKCNEYGVLLDITSNGTLLTEEKIAEILPCLLDIKISFDGMKAETFERIRKGAKQEIVIRNIKNFIKMRNDRSSMATITLQMTLFNFNYREFPDVIRFAHEIGVDRVKAYPVFSYSKDIDNLSIFNDFDAFHDVREECLELAEKLNLKIGIAEPCSDTPTEAEKNLIHQKCRLPWAECFIDYNGAVYPCHTHNHIALGNIFTQTASDVWNSQYTISLREKLISNNLKGCICHNCGNNYIRTDLKQPVPYNKNDYLFEKGEDHNIHWGKRCKQFLLDR